MARLGDIVTVSPSTLENTNEQVWLLNLDMVEQKTGNILAYNYVSKKELNGSIIQFDTGNVLYSKLRPNLNKVVLPLQAGYATSEMLPLRPNVDIITREYLAIYLRSNCFATWASSKTAGAKMPRLGTKDLLNKEIPLPSLVKQQEIVDVTNSISKLTLLYKQQLVKLDELVKARFVEMFGEHEQVFQAQLRLLPADLPAAVGGVVANFADEVHPPPDVRAHNVPEVLGVHEADQRVLPGLVQGLVYGVHPLHGELHRPAAVEHAGVQIHMQQLLRRRRHLPEGGEIGVREEKIKVGHRRAPPYDF